MPLLPLPIARSIEREEDGHSMLSSCTPSAYPMSLASEEEQQDGSSFSDALKLSVKNTFIDFETIETSENWELPLHQHGAKTCTARLSHAVGGFHGASQEEEMEEQEEEASTEAKDSDLSDFEQFNVTIEATPAADDYASVQKLLGMDVFDMPPPGLQESQTVPCLAPAQAHQGKETPSQARQVMLQIPVEVAAAAPDADDDLEVAIVSKRSESLGGCTVVDLRIIVGPSGELRVLQSPAGQALLTASLASGAPSQAAASHDGTSTAGSSLPPSPVPSHTVAAEAPREAAMPAEHRAGRAKTAGSSEKSTMVCCHWKNTGWCKYQSSCRFMHPEHKRGVGSRAVKGAVAPGVPPGSSPGGVRVGGFCPPQHAGGNSRRLWAQHSPAASTSPGGARVAGGFMGADMAACTADAWRFAAVAAQNLGATPWPGSAPYVQSFSPLPPMGA